MAKRTYGKIGRFAQRPEDIARIRHWATKQRTRGVPASDEALAYAGRLFPDPCAYCGTTAVPRQIEHIVPVGAGGLTTVDNLAPACPQCNQRKADKPLFLFLAQLGSPVKLSTLAMRRYEARHRDAVNARRRERYAAKRKTA